MPARSPKRPGACSRRAASDCPRSCCCCGDNGSALRRSSAILKQKWGESLAGEARFGLISILFMLQAMLMFFLGLALVLSKGASAYLGLGPILIAFGVVYAVATMIVIQALTTIFQAGVYLYATSGQVPATLDADMVEGAFRPKT